MKYITRILQFFYVVYAIILFVSLMFLVLPVAAVASFFGRIRGGNFIYKLCRMWGNTWLLLIGICHKNIYMTPHVTDRAYIYVANHISYMDIPVLLKSLQAPIRILGKIEMSKIPVFGFLYKQTVVMVDRSSGEHRAKSVRVLKAILKKRISVVIFPEGGFNTTGQPLKEFYSGAFRIAIEMQTPIKPVIFPDTLDRLHHEDILSLSPGISRAIFMEEIPVAGLTLRDVDGLQQKVYDLMDAELRNWKKYDEIAQDYAVSA